LAHFAEHAEKWHRVAADATNSADKRAAARANFETARASYEAAFREIEAARSRDDAEREAAAKAAARAGGISVVAYEKRKRQEQSDRWFAEQGTVVKVSAGQGQAFLLRLPTK
jgi:hypothetical protein